MGYQSPSGVSLRLELLGLLALLGTIVVGAIAATIFLIALPFIALLSLTVWAAARASRILRRPTRLGVLPGICDHSRTMARTA